MPGSRFFAVSSGVPRIITTSPAVVPISGAEQLCAGVFVYVGDDVSEFGNILECFDQLKLTRCEIRSDGAVGVY